MVIFHCYVSSPEGSGISMRYIIHNNISMSETPVGMHFVWRWARCIQRREISWKPTCELSYLTNWNAIFAGFIVVIVVIVILSCPVVISHEKTGDLCRFFGRPRCWWSKIPGLIQLKGWSSIATPKKKVFQDGMFINHLWTCLGNINWIYTGCFNQQYWCAHT